MRNTIHIIKKKALMLVIFIVLAALAPGCTSPAGPSADDAENYVKALLDLSCTGSYDNSVTLSEVSRDRELEIRDSIMDDLYLSAVEEAPLEEDVRGLFREFLVKAGQNCRYSVVEVSKSGNQASAGSPEYDVTVSIEPLKAFKGASDLLDREMEAMKNDTGKLVNTDPEAICSIAFRKVFPTLIDQLDQPEYAAPERVTVHYCLIDEEKNLYGVSGEDCTRMGEKLFSLEGLDQTSSPSP